MEFPETTAEVIINGFARAGRLVSPEESPFATAKGDIRLYVFVGDAVSGPTFEVWLTAEEASNAEPLSETVGWK